MFGIERGIVLTDVATDKALEQLTVISNVSNDLALLATERDLTKVLELVGCLAADECSISEDEICKKWLYLRLAWIYQIRDLLEDPLGAVEGVYADSGYPPEMASFVRYMPMVGQDLGSREKNEARMYFNWRSYMQASRERYRNEG